jgi:predicted kinase
VGDIRQKAIEFIGSKWKIEKIDNFEEIVKVCYQKMIKDVFSVKNPYLLRIAGQSGSGKTTQLLPSIESILDKNFIKIAVRNFALYYPDYNNFSKDIVREKTNGFALLLLFRVIELLIKDKYNILFEVTILDPNFEQYLNELAKQNHYTLHFHVLSIPLKKSTEWIEKRQKETGRIVLKSSANYFYDILPISLSKILNYDFLTKEDKFYLWNAFERAPVFQDKKGFMEKFLYYRNYINFKEKKVECLLKMKKKWFIENYHIVDRK